jgi:hypothetical protein
VENDSGAGLSVLGLRFFLTDVWRVFKDSEHEASASPESSGPSIARRFRRLPWRGEYVDGSSPTGGGDLGDG